MTTDTTEKVKILIADDHPIFRGGLKAVIEKEPTFTVVAEADNGAEALVAISDHSPDVAVLDLDMPELDGFQVARRIKDQQIPVRVIVLTMHKDEMHFNKAIDCGVSGYVIKDGAAAEVVGCIKSVMSGKEYFSPVLSTFLIERIRKVTSFSTRPGIGDLTPTERQVLHLLAQLKTSKEIAADLGTSPRTVENHRAHICAKLELQGAHALTKFAIQHKDDLL